LWDKKGVAGRSITEGRKGVQRGFEGALSEYSTSEMQREFQRSYQEGQTRIAAALNKEVKRGVAEFFRESWEVVVGIF
jgi:hypothetical protein